MTFKPVSRMSNAVSHLFLAAVLACTLPPAQAEATEAKAVRSADKPDQASTRLSETIYRTESYEDDYTVSVPYEDTEIYTEQVPYEAQETYTDYETYTENEYRCHNETRHEQRCEPEQKCTTTHRRECRPHEECRDVPRQRCEMRERCRDVPRHKCEDREVCHQVPKRECTTTQECREVPSNDGSPPRPECHPKEECHVVYENQCHTRPDCRMEHERECHQEQECNTEHERQCETREVCHDVPEQQCRTEVECRQVPVPHEVCGWEPVTKTRAVTKTRTVIKYRDEQRTRTVIRHREETRCCVTKYRQVRDHDYVANVQLHFPSEATLEAGERETFNIELTGTDEKAGIRVTPRDAIYNYEPQIKQTSANDFDVVMKLVPTYKAEDLGLTTIKDLGLKLVAENLVLNFKDSGAVRKVKTSYALQLFDPQSGAVIYQEQRENTAGERVNWRLNLTLPSGTEVRSVLTIARAGVVITAPIQFVVEKKVKIAAEAAYDPKPYANIHNVDKLAITGKRPALTLTFTDITKVIEQVTTAYNVKLSLVGTNESKLLGTKLFAREGLKTDAKKRYNIRLVEDLDVNAEVLRKLKSGSVLKAEIEVRRTGSRLKPNPLAFTRSGKFKVK